jgi:hypothetical protein
MKNYLVAALAVAMACSASSNVFAVSKLKKAFADQYAGEKANEDLKGLVKKAGCYVCHVKGEDKKKVRNVYGKALHEAFEKDKFPLKDWSKDPEKYADRLKDLFKKVEEAESGDKEHKTFGARIKANLLPGGDVEGKKEE